MTFNWTVVILTGNIRSYFIPLFTPFPLQMPDFFELEITKIK